MLPLSTIVCNLTTMQQLKLERSVQDKVSFDSPVLAVLNGLLLGETETEIIERSYISKRFYPRFERPVYSTLLEMFELKATNSRDLFMSELHYAVFEQEYENDHARGKALENLFHQLKRYGMEQESAPLLQELYLLNQESPLKAVYEHLQKKYAHFNAVNNQAFEILDGMNQKLASYLGADNREVSIKDLKQDFKNIRSLHGKVANNTSDAIFKLAKLILVSICKQEQLMKEEENLTLQLLAEQTRKAIEFMPFGIERFYLKNILKQIIDYANHTMAMALEEVVTTTLEAPNFSFELAVPGTAVSEKKKRLKLNAYFKKFSAYTIPQNSLMIR